MLIKVMSTVRTHRVYDKSFDIDICPHCKSCDIMDIDASKFNGCDDFSIWFRAYRTYYYRQIGQKDIKLSLKAPKVK